MCDPYFPDWTLTNRNSKQLEFSSHRAPKITNKGELIIHSPHPNPSKFKRNFSNFSHLHPYSLIFSSLGNSYPPPSPRTLLVPFLFILQCPTLSPSITLFPALNCAIDLFITQIKSVSSLKFLATPPPCSSVLSALGQLSCPRLQVQLTDILIRSTCLAPTLPKVNNKPTFSTSYYYLKGVSPAHQIPLGKRSTAILYSFEFLFEDMAFLLLFLPPKMQTVFPFFLLTFHIKLFIYWLVPWLSICIFNPLQRLIDPTARFVGPMKHLRSTW